MLGSLAVLSLAVFAAAQKVYSAKEDGLSQHTIYMPDTAGKIPILVWSSGGCIRDGTLCCGTVSFHQEMGALTPRS
jgi:hypothetical protein